MYSLCRLWALTSSPLSPLKFLKIRIKIERTTPQVPQLRFCVPALDLHHVPAASLTPFDGSFRSGDEQPSALKTRFASREFDITTGPGGIAKGGKKPREPQQRVLHAKTRGSMVVKPCKRQCNGCLLSWTMFSTPREERLGLQIRRPAGTLRNYCCSPTSTLLPDEMSHPCLLPNVVCQSIGWLPTEF